jgi:hypothetical protein
MQSPESSIFGRVEFIAGDNKTLTLRFKRRVIGCDDIVDSIRMLKKVNLRLFRLIQFNFRAVHRLSSPAGQMLAALAGLGRPEDLKVELLGLRGAARREANVYVKIGPTRNFSARK